MKSGELTLDYEDVCILDHLQLDGRASDASLAEATGIELGACKERRRHLERQGQLLGYGARVSLSGVAHVMTVFAQVTLSDHRKEDMQRFERRIESMAEIVECHLISGEFDYLLKCFVRDVAHYESLVAELRDGDLGVCKCLGYIATHAPLEQRPLPVSSLLSLA